MCVCCKTSAHHLTQCRAQGGRFNYYNSVVDNGTHVMLYYDARGTLPNWAGRTTCLAVSKDGVNFER